MLLLLTPVVSPACAFADATPSPYAAEVTAGVEEIYVFRTTRTEHHSGATPACQAAPFASVNEDYYALWSIALRTADSRVVKTHERAVGGFRACFGPLAKGQPLPMYATGTVAGVSWIGLGECTALESQPPVPTVVAFNCRLSLSGLPESYTGGFAVSSTEAVFLGKNQPPGAHVPGYLSTSVVTVRLWRRAR